jgi:SAM-dependent methyltransferase
LDPLRWLADRREGIRQRIVDAIRLAQYRPVFPFLREVECDRISFSTRGAVVLGASLDRCIRIIRHHTPLRGRSVLILGCGRGEEIHRWVKEHPARILAVDYLDYREHWASIAYPNVRILQADIRTFEPGEQFDLVTSKAVLEHIDGLESVFERLVKPLKVGGYFWADFGPLYCTWGGAHAPLAYDHLRLPERDYAAKLDAPQFAEARLFWDHGLFSRLTYPQYMALFGEHLERRYLAVQVSDDALHFREANRGVFDALAAEYGERDLLLKSIFYLGRKTHAPCA